MRILLIRHGKTKGNLENRYVGRTDEPILEESARALRQKNLGGFCPDAVYASRMLRCIQTAQCLFPEREICIRDGLEETDFGAFEYKCYEELNGDPAYQAWIDSGGMSAFPGGESGADFRKRCCRAFRDCVEDAKSRGAKTAAVVAHGGTIMAVMEAFGEPKRDFYDWQPANGGGFLTELREAEGDVSLVCRAVL